MARLLVALALVSSAWAESDPVRIDVAASRGEIIPQSKGGGGFQRLLRFTAVPGKVGRWIRQELAVRGTVFDAAGRTRAVHLDIIEYFRVDRKGRTRLDNHYSQFWSARGGDLMIESRLTYGVLKTRKLGDTIVNKGFILRSCLDAEGKRVTMKTRTLPRQVIPAEYGARVEFEPHAHALPTRYGYRVQWDTRRSRTQPSGEIEVGTWLVELPPQEGPTQAIARPQPIPRIRRRY